MHQIEPLVDVAERQPVRNQIVNIDLPIHIPVDDFGYVSTASGAAEGGPFPNATGDQLKRSCGDFLPGSGHANNDADTPATVAAFERLAHDIDIADALETVIGATFGQIDEIEDEVALDTPRIDEMGHPELLCECPSLGVEIDTNDHVGSR